MTPIILIAGATLLVATRTRVVLGAYLALVVIAIVEVPRATFGAPLPLAVVLVTMTMKAVVAPLAVLAFLRAYPTASDLHTSLTLPLRLLLAIAFAVAAGAVAHLPGLEAGPPVLPAAFVVLCSVGMLIVHRNVVAHLIGLLALGAGITLAGAVLAPQLPEAVELGATFDALVGTFVGLALLRAVVTREGALDVESLRSLRG